MDLYTQIHLMYKRIVFMQFLDELVHVIIVKNAIIANFDK